MNKITGGLSILIIIFLVLFLFLYFFQEKLIFLPERLPRNYSFEFPQKYEEVSIETTDKAILNGILFKADSSRGLVFYLHGNAGSIRLWGQVAKTYTDLGYDVFLLDYRGYGKSEGKINGENQLFGDVQTAYDKMKATYPENKIVVLGYSIGTGLAANLASRNNPRMLILQAPYYSLTDLLHHRSKIIPTFLLKYKLETYKYLQDCKMPVVIFHGDADQVIYYNSSVKLMQLLKKTDTLISLPGQRHNGITDNPDYKKSVKEILSR